MCVNLADIVTADKENYMEVIITDELGNHFKLCGVSYSHMGIYRDETINFTCDCEYIEKCDLGDVGSDTPVVQKILKNPAKNATTVFWGDGTKTVVKKSPEDPDDDYFAFCSALAIKMYGSNSKLHRMLKNKTEVLVKKKKEKSNERSGQN